VCLLTSQSLHVGIELAVGAGDDEHAIVFAALAADGCVTFDLQRHVALDAIEERLIRMRVGAERPDTAFHFHLAGDGVVRTAIGEIQLRVKNVVDPESGGCGNFVIRDVCAVGQDVIARVGVSAIEISVGAAIEREFFGGFHFAHVQQHLADVHPFDARQDFLRGRGLFGVELAVESDFVALHTVFFYPFEEKLEQVYRLALHDLAQVRECALGVQEIEVEPAAAEPPASDQVAIERGIQIPGRVVILIHEDGLRAFGGGVPVASEIDDVPAVAKDEGFDAALRETFLEAADLLFVPFKRQAVSCGGLRRAFLTRNGAEQPPLAGAGGALIHDLRKRRARGGGLHAGDFVHARQQASAQQRCAGRF